jgi:hypothetical protein
MPRGIPFVSRAVNSFPEPDHDRDGHESVAHGGDDCDDSDGRRYPGRAEIADIEGHDEDCDEGTIGVRDQDHDGFTSWRAMYLARGDLGQPVAILRGPDCDDNRADINPGSSEVLGDLRDNNCDGLIDAFDSVGHADYCAPISQTLARHPSPCGTPAGDTRQFDQPGRR